MLATNYIVCFALSWSFAGFENLFPQTDGLLAALGMGSFNGLFYMLALVFGQYCISKNGVILSSVFSKTGALIIPLVMSVLVFREVPSVFQVIGFLLAMLAVFALTYQKEDGANGKVQWSLFALFIAEGCAGIMAKVFREKGNDELEFHFLLYTFLIAFFLCLIAICFKKERFGKQELLYGLMIGVPNYFATRFLLLALGMVPAVVVYPAKSVATIGLITLAGCLAFHEKLKKVQWIAMGVTVVVLILLSI